MENLAALIERQAAEIARLTQENKRLATNIAHLKQGKLYDALESVIMRVAMYKVSKIPAADVKEVVYASYVTNDDGDSHCSACGENWLDITKNFCPNCGSDMRGRKE